MVRTRSGKSTTKAEKVETKEAQQPEQSESPAGFNIKPSPLNVGFNALKKVLSPIVSPFTSPFKSTINSPLKKPAPMTNLTSILRSPSIAVSRLPWHRQLSQDLTVWSPTEKTFTLWACIVAVAVLVVCCDSVYWQIGAKYPDFHFLALVLAIHAVDVLTNFLNEFKSNGGLDVAILFSLYLRIFLDLIALNLHGRAS